VTSTWSSNTLEVIGVNTFLIQMFSTLVLFFSTCNNLVNSGNQQERLVDNSNSYSEAKSNFRGVRGGRRFDSASVKVHSDFRFGVNVQPLDQGPTPGSGTCRRWGQLVKQAKVWCNLTINGKHILAEFKDLFDGSLHLKPGSPKV
jgi:hypothetical protein